MVILRLIYNEDVREDDEIKELKNSLKKENILIKHDVENNNTLSIVSDKDNKTITEYDLSCISLYLYKLILDKYLKEKMDEFLRETYFFLKESEIEEVKSLIIDVLLNKNKSEYEIDVKDKINLILKLINDDISENDELNIKGFLTFRVKKIFTIIENIIDKVIETYMINKEYIEFINLMKYFVDMQECKIPGIIINKNNDKYIVTDSHGNDLYAEFLISIGELEKIDINMEDIILSGLISYAPKNIEIHNKENFENKEFMKVIEKVFGDKVTYFK